MSLNFLVFLGSVRDSTPPSPPRLGLRVAKACVAHIQHGDQFAELIDPLAFELEPIFKPHFTYTRGKAPTHL